MLESLPRIISTDGSICILDYAYIYSLSYRGFLCTCEDEGVLTYDNDYNYLKCPFCNKKWSFEDIRKRISKQDELNEIGDIKTCGYLLSSDIEELEINEEFSPQYKKHEKKKKVRFKVKEEKEPDISAEDQMKLMAELNAKLGGYKNG